MTMSGMGLPLGAFFTSINGKQCTAVPKFIATSTVATSNVPQTTGTQATDIPQTETPQSMVYSTPAQSTQIQSITGQPSSKLQDYEQTATEPASEQQPETTQSAPLPTTDQQESRRPSQSIVDDAPLTVTSQEESSRVTAPATPTTKAVTILPGLVGSPETSVGLATRTDTLATGGGPSMSTPDAPPYDTLSTGASSSENGNAKSISTAAIIGTVLGGAAFLFLLALVLWWLRRRSLRKYHNSLLTPLTVPSSFYSRRRAADKAARSAVPLDGDASASLAPRHDTLRAVIGTNLNRFRDQVNSTLLGRTGSTPSANLDRGTAQFIEQSPRISDILPFRHSVTRNSPLSAFDFGSATGKRYSNPFSDTNAMPHESAAVPPLDPFGHFETTINATAVNINSPSSPLAPPPGHESMGSIQPTLGPRSKFRSDPFDLLRPESIAPSRTTAASPLPVMEYSLISLEASYRDSYLSRYSSGVSNSSLGGWGEPGPDVRPLATERITGG